jgi:hypothetical protein
VAVVPPETWDAIVQHDPEVAVLEAAETGGIDALRALLALFGLHVLDPISAPDSVGPL